MNPFKFNGDWEYQIELPSFKELQSRKGAYTSKSKSSINDGIIMLIFEDDLTEQPDPYPEQLHTINYILKNQELIKEKIISRTLKELPILIKDYGWEEEDGFKNLSRESVVHLFGISSITILITSKNGSAYYDVSGGCNWDEEHGLNFLMHEDRILTFGGIEGNSYWEAIKDNGTYEEIKNRKAEKTIPKKYKAHPKYGKLKPSQQMANETFAFNLISGGHNLVFKEMVAEGEIDINGKWESQNKTHLEAACWFNNNELVKFLLSKGADIRYALHQCLGYNSNPKAFDLILKHGGDINQKDLGGRTILSFQSQELARLYDAKMQRQRSNIGNVRAYDEKIKELKKVIEALIMQGADPEIKNSNGYNAYSAARNLSPYFKDDMETFIQGCVKRRNAK